MSIERAVAFKGREMKMKKILLAAALIASGCGLALAQGGGGGEPPKASDPNPPAAVRNTPGEAKSAPGLETQKVKMKKKKKAQGAGAAATDTKNRATGAETGSAKDPAGPAGIRAAPGTGNTK